MASPIRAKHSSWEDTMPLDHYVSQVHLKKFYSPVLGNRMYAIRKTDLKSFTPNSESVCRITEGSTNAYLDQDRAIESFLKTIEPNYNAALDDLIAEKIDDKCIYTIAGFVAYITACSPAAMRIQSGPLKSILETTATMMDARGLFPTPPPVLAGESLTDLLRSGAVEFTIDPKYPQAIGISSILKLTTTFGNFKWEILHNHFDDSPFFTSDFPVAIEETNNPHLPNRIVPLAPALAIRIRLDPTVDQSKSDCSFTKFGFRRRNLDKQEVISLNRLIVRCAEDTVFYRDDHSWVLPFVSKNQRYRIHPYARKVATSTGMLQVSMQRVAVSSDQGAD